MAQKKGTGGLVAGSVVAVVAILISLAVVFANKEGSSQVAEHGRIAIRAEATLSAASAARNAVGQAVVLARRGDVGAAAGNVVTEGLAAAEALVVELDRRFEILLGELPRDDLDEALIEAQADFREVTGQVLEAVRAGDLDRAERLAGESAQEGYEALVARLVDLRNTRTAQVVLAGDGVGRVADAARFLVAFVVPLGAMLGYRRVVRVRQRRRELEQSLQHEREMSRSKDEFIANLSHELRTPLTGIHGFALTLEESGFEDRQTAAEMTAVIVGESAELMRMVDDLLAVGKLEAGDMSYEIDDVTVSEELEAVLDPFERTGRVFSVECEPAVVRADRLRVRQVLRNLVSNACKHGGPTISIQGEAGEGTYLLEVIDDGDGVPPELEVRLFERYVHEGSAPLLAGSVGLGLAIAYSLADGMDGRLSYRRDDGLSVFELRVPLAQAPMAA